MTSGQAPTDAAWVAIEVPIAPEKLRAFCRDLERLYRINPYLEIRAWKPAPHGAVTAFRNLSNGREYALELRVGDKTYQLTQMESDLLAYLVRNAGKAVSRKAILEDVWALHEDTDTRAIDNFIVRLRRYLEDDPSKPRLLLTVRSVGYKMAVD